jgi:hypothetical protein
VDVGMSADTDQNYTVTFGVRAALQADENHKYSFVDPKTGGLSTVGARAFMDVDGDGQFSEDKDKPIDQVQFRSSYGGSNPGGNKDGVTWIRGLGESPTRISMQTDTIPDIYMQPNFNFKDIVPRKGVNPIIDFPFSELGEIEGIVTHGKAGVANVPVRIRIYDDKKNVIYEEETLTESDGYFIFSALKKGQCNIDASPVGFEDESKLSDYVGQQVELGEKGNLSEKVSLSLTDKFMELLKTFNDSDMGSHSIADMKALTDIILDDSNIKAINQGDVEQILKAKIVE